MFANRTIKRYIMISLLIIFIIWTIWGNLTIKVSEYKIVDKNLPSGFNGYKIVQISDFHNAHYSRDNSYVTDKIKTLRPNIIVITGDLVDSRRTDVNTACRFVKKLTEIAPTYYVNGNHESRIGEKYNRLEKKLKEYGVTVLRNRYCVLKNNKSSIKMIGVDDPNFYNGDSWYMNTGDKIKAELNYDKDVKISSMYKILLSHRSEAFDSYVDMGMNLVFSGHAHGGQFRLPFVGGLVAPGQGIFPKYDLGVFEEENTKMVVSAGLGNSIIPVRINNRPEIVMVKLYDK